MPDSFSDDSFVRAHIVSRLRARLGRDGLTQSELARRLGTSPAYVSQVLALRTNPSFDTLRSFAVSMGLPDAEFDRLVRQAKEAEVDKHRSSDDPNALLRQALVANGLDEDEDIPKILSYIDFQKHERARRADRN
jgi:transcriptional regulator with XRE-family HTH domain